MRHQDDVNNILPKDGEVLFYPGFFSADECRRYLTTLQKEIAWKQEPIVIFGKKILQPRLTAWLGDEGTTYRYSGLTMHPQKWTPSILEIKNKIEAISNGVKFNSVLLNLYRDGQDSMGWHRDNEKELGPNPTIGSVTFGAERKFIFRHYQEKNLKKEVALTNGSYLVMKGETQHHWQHALPKVSQATGVRINLTFRRLLISS
jgi:alkylated DNA repair dioxygenase AlkB